MGAPDDDGPPHPLPRAWLGLASAASLLVFLALTALVQGDTGSLRLDNAGERLIRTSGAFDLFDVLSEEQSTGVWGEVTALGAPLPGLVMAGGLAAVAYRRRDRLAFALCLAGPVLAMTLALIAKPLVNRTQDSVFSFPSGHATVAAALATLVLVLIARWYGPRALLRWGPVVIAVPLAVGFAVVRLDWHYLTDALGGFALAVAAVLFVAAALPERLSAPRGEPVPAIRPHDRQRSGSVESSS